MEEVLGAEETPQRIGLHAQEPVQKRRGVSTFSSRSRLWYDDWVSSKNTDLLMGSDSALAQVPRRLKCLMLLPLASKIFVQASCFISSVVYIITQLLQNHSFRCSPSSGQSPFIASSMASFLLRLNAQRPTGFLLPLLISGRFDEAVIEERRKAAEAMFLFTTNIPALYNSPHLKEFLRVRITHRLTAEVCVRRRRQDLPCSFFLSLPLIKCHVALSAARVVRPPGRWIPRV